MRAKVYVEKVVIHQNGEEVFFKPVSGKMGADSIDEDNTYSKYTPSGELRLFITNPALFGTYKPDHTKKFYVDFTPAPVPAQ